MQRLLKFFDERISFRALLWFIPVVLAVHNCEEALTMPSWVPENLSSIRGMIPFHFTVYFSSKQLLISLFLATVIPFLIVFFCADGEKGSAKLDLLFILQLIIFLNIFIPHIAVSVIVLRYNPGVITAIALNLPFSFYFFRRALIEGYLVWKKMKTLFLVSLLLYPIVALLLHYGGEFIARRIFG